MGIPSYLWRFIRKLLLWLWVGQGHWPLYKEI